MKFEIKNRWTGAVQFEYELSAEMVGHAYSVQLGFAVKKAVEGRADLRGADLRGADLSGAVLSGADLSGAVLSGADLSGAVLSGAVLSGAVLSGAVLRSFKADLWMTLTQNPHEVPAVIAALREGRVNGSVYEGACACLVGTIANARGISVDNLEHDARHPAEKWFLMIKTGDRPGDDTGGGFAAQKALEWSMEWCALNGVEIPADSTL